MLRFVILFIVLLLGLFWAYVLKPVEVHFVDPFTGAVAWVSTQLIHLFDDNVTSQGKMLQSTLNGFAVSIERGCNGMEAVIILFAAVFAFPASLLQKLAGFAAGFVAIQALNIVRIISLFYLGQWSQVWFDWFHLYLWQALIIIDALVVWLLWLRWISRTTPRPSGTPTATAAA